MRLDFYPKAGCGSAKFGRLKHDGCIQAKSLIQSVNGAFLRSGVLCRQLEPRQEIDSHRVARGLHSLWWPRSCFGTWNSANLTSKIRQSPHHSKLDGRGLSQLRRVSLRKLKTKSVSLHGCTLRLCLSPLRKKVFKLPSLSDFQPPPLSGYFTLSAHNRIRVRNSGSAAIRLGAGLKC